MSLRIDRLLLISILLAGPVLLSAQAPPSPPCGPSDAAYLVDLALAQGKPNILEGLSFQECPAAEFFARGYAALQLGQLEEAQQYLEPKTASDSGEPYSQFARGLLSLKRKRALEAQQLWEPLTSLPLPCDLQVRLLNNLGTLRFSQGDREAAKGFYRRAEEAARGCERAAPVAPLVSQNLAMMSFIEQDYSGAVHAYEALLGQPGLLMSPVTRSKALSNLGLAYERVGRYYEALDSLQRSVALLDPARDGGPLSSSLYNLSLVYLQLGMLGKAQESLDEAISLMKTRGDDARLAKALGSQGLLATRRLDNELAERSYQQSLQLARSKNDVTTVISTLNNLGSLYIQIGQPEKAVPVFEQVVAQSGELRDRYRGAVARASLAKALLRMGQTDQALSLLDEASSFAEESGSSDLRWNILWFQGQALWARGEREGSLERYRDAVALLNDLRKSLKVEELQKSYTGKVVEVYEDYLQKLLLDFEASRDGDVARTAFSAMEMKKAQILLEFLSRAGVARPRQAELGGLRALRQTLSREKALFLSYSLGDEGSQLVLVSPAGVELYPLPPGPVLEAQVRAALQALRDGERGGPRLAKLRALVEPALGRRGVRTLILSPDGALHMLPFEALPAGKGRYLIEAYAVRYAPSASVLAELLALPPSRNGDLLALGGPDFQGSLPLKKIEEERGVSLAPLPYAREEAEAVAGLFAGRGRALTGARATESAVKACGEGGEALRFLHFATHGIVEERSPQYSGLALSPGGGEDGYLTVQEILGLSLPCDLVALSACDTGRGEIARGEGVFGFGRAFLYAGARDVLVSLWKVNDLAAARLMEAFYRELSRGAGPDQALRSAKLELLRHGIKLAPKERAGAGRPAGREAAGRATVDASAPLYWAPFVLVGH